MDIYPAIDLLDGRCVRLYQGDYGRATVYGDDPVAQAGVFVTEGAGWVHMVDLDAARTGAPRNRDMIAAVARSLANRDGARLQVGGGVRDDASAEALLAAGVDRVVVGTAALEQPAWALDLARRHPGQVAVGLDAHGRDVAVRGWTESSGRDVVEVARQFEGGAVAALVVTEIGRDGTLAGPALDQLGAVLEATTLEVVASGGVGALADLEALAGLSTTGPDGAERRLGGVIVGRAIYEGAFAVTDALTTLAKRTTVRATPAARDGRTERDQLAEGDTFDD